jgi:hypothetical protein
VITDLVKLRHEFESYRGIIVHVPIGTPCIQENISIVLAVGRPISAACACRVVSVPSIPNPRHRDVCLHARERSSVQIVLLWLQAVVCRQGMWTVGLM